MGGPEAFLPARHLRRSTHLKKTTGFIHHGEPAALVFVTVGNATQGFLRLLEGVDSLAGRGLFGDDPVIIQRGNNPRFRASHCRQQDFFAPEEFIHMIDQAAVVICHGGEGTLMHLLQMGKVPVVVPRQKKYGEHIDDHQVELTRVLASEGRIIPAYELDGLPAAVNEARQRLLQPTPPVESGMIELVARAIADLARGKR
jgi:UDP-N-acetylglucosamine transferase subunit ALG13